MGGLPRGVGAAPKEGSPPLPLSLSTAHASPGLDEQLFRSVEGQAASDEEDDHEKWQEVQRPPAEVTALLAGLSGCGSGYVLPRGHPGSGIPGAGPPQSSWEHRGAPLCSDGPGTWEADLLIHIQAGSPPCCFMLGPRIHWLSRWPWASVREK